MAEKNVLVIIKSRPYTTLNSYEGLRVAIGLWDHHVSILWTGEGVYNLLKEADHTRTSNFYADFPDLNIKTHVDTTALEARNIKLDELITGIRAMDGGQIAEMMLGANLTLVF
ncbi:MAG: DsrE family protein [Candidatus Bathyarchaeota archaeon]|jgi:sulfur relay (sulfurtransferase) DsrF/TusC family protein